MNSFTFDGIPSSLFGFKIREKNIYSSPERSQEIVSIPGRDGDVIFDNGSFKNVEVTYKCDFRNIENNASAIKNWLCKSGYKILTDTYDPSTYRMAALVYPLNISELIRDVGTVELKFSCKPYKYLNSGDDYIPLSKTESTEVTNNQSYSSLPLFKIKAKGKITLNITSGGISSSRVITFPSTSTELYIDSELMAVYKADMTLFNNTIDFVDFPIFMPGKNLISFTVNTGATLTSASVKPRWRKL